jgi:tetratricopeptide (TPR) repeat protein
VLFVDVGFAHATACLVGFSVEDGEIVTSADFPDAVCSAPCGVRTFLDAMMTHCCGVIEQKHKRKVGPESKQATRLRTALQKALKDLSVGPDAQINLECFFPDDDIDISITITREQLQELIAADVQTIGSLLSAALEKAGKDWGAITNVEVIGGGSRVVAVQEALRSQIPEHMVLGAGLDSSSCVAVGATYFNAASSARPANVKATSTESKEPAELGVGELDTWLKQVHGEEVKRLQCENEFEAYIYKVKGWLNGPDKALVAPAAAEVDKWQLWLEDAQIAETDFATYDAKFTEIKDFMADKCAAYFKKVEEDAAKKEKELDEAAEKERQRRKEAGMDNDKDDRSMPKSERFRLAENNKVEGTDMFKAGKFDDAIRRYKKAVDHISRPEVAQNMSPEEKEQADKIKTGCYLNMSLCYSKAAAQVESEKDKNAAEPFYKKAKTSLDDCLDIGENVKARFRRANMWEKLGDIEKAMEDIKAALKVEPEDADLLKSKARFEKVMDKQKKAQQKMYGKMFG